MAQLNRRIAISLLLSMISHRSMAIGLGSSCSSQGYWTKEALSGFTQLRTVAEILANSGDIIDPYTNKVIGNKCTNLSLSLKRVIEDSQKAMDQRPPPDPKADEKETPVTDIPRELGALKSYYSSIRKNGSDPSILNMMAAKAVHYASELNRVQDGESLMDGSKKDLGSLAIRLRSTSDAALASLSAFIDELPGNEECIYGNTGEAALIGSLVNIMAVLASGGPSTVGLKLASTINKLSLYLREVRFASVAQLLNNAEFQNSMACLLESASEAFCAARDANYALLRGQKLITQQQQSNKTISDPKNPMNGYFILTHAIPTVTDWLLKVQIGVKPRTAQDAQFKKVVMSNVQGFFNSVFDLQGKLSQAIQTIKNYKDKDTQTIAIGNMIIDLSHEMGAGGRAGSSGFGDDSAMNFFLQGRLGIEVPFEIAGMPPNSRPKAVITTDANVARTMTPEAWFKTPDGRTFIEEKIQNSVDNYLDVISENIDKIVTESTRSAISYYGTWFIVDNGHLVSESVTGINYTVRDSLELIYDYLYNFSERAANQTRLAPLLANVQETMFRIQRILVEYRKASSYYTKEFAPYIQKLKQANLERFKLDNRSPKYFRTLGGVDESCQTADGKLIEGCLLATQYSDINLQKMIHRVDDYNSSIVNTIYDELNVLLSRSSFLANRVSVFVEADFLNQIGQSQNISEFERDFYVATGLGDYKTLMDQFQTSPDAAAADLAQALVLNKTSLVAIEWLFRNKLPQEIERLKAISENRSDSPNSMSRNSAERLFHESDPVRDNPVATDTERELMQKERNSWDPLSQAWRGLRILGKGLYRKVMHGDRFSFDIDILDYDRISSPTDEFGSHKKTYEKLCIQILAFNDPSLFELACGKVVLKSILNHPQAGLLAPQVRRFVERSAVSWVEKQKEGRERLELQDENKWKSYNHSVRICAYRDFLRNSLVANLTSAKNLSKYDPSTSEQAEAMIDVLVNYDARMAEESRKKNEEVLLKRKQAEESAANQKQPNYQANPQSGASFFPNGTPQELNKAGLLPSGANNIGSLEGPAGPVIRVCSVNFSKKKLKSTSFQIFSCG